MEQAKPAAPKPARPLRSRAPVAISRTRLEWAPSLLSFLSFRFFHSHPIEPLPYSRSRPSTAWNWLWGRLVRNRVSNMSVNLSGDHEIAQFEVEPSAALFTLARRAERHGRDARCIKYDDVPPHADDLGRHLGRSVLLGQLLEGAADLLRQRLHVTTLNPGAAEEHLDPCPDLSRVHNAFQLALHGEQIRARAHTYIHIDSAVGRSPVRAVRDATANSADVHFRDHATAHRDEGVGFLVAPRPILDPFNDLGHLHDGVRMSANIGWADGAWGVHIAARDADLEVAGAACDPRNSEIRGFGNQGVIGSNSVRHQKTASNPFAVIARPLVFIHRRTAGLADNRSEYHVTFERKAGVAQGPERDHSGSHQPTIVQNRMPEQPGAFPVRTRAVDIRLSHQPIVLRSGDFSIHMGIEDEACAATGTLEHGDNIGAVRKDRLLVRLEFVVLKPGMHGFGHRQLMPARAERVCKLQSQFAQLLRVNVLADPFHL